MSLEFLQYHALSGASGLVQRDYLAEGNIHMGISVWGARGGGEGCTLTDDQRTSSFTHARLAARVARHYTIHWDF